jgi:hypothetical protein
MKKYHIIGIRGAVPYILAKNGTMRTCLDLNPSGGREFLTAMGAHNYIKKEVAAGTGWQLAVMEAAQ